MRKTDVTIIGAGASGLMAAIRCAQRGKKVVILEFSDKPAKKILVTGNGKCNLTNKYMNDSCYNSFSEDSEYSICDIMKPFGSTELLAFMKGIGIPTRERDGYYYPYCESAQAIADAMVRCAVSLGTEIINNSIVKSVSALSQSDYRFNISYNDDFIYSKSLIICTGSNAGLNKLASPSGYSLAKQLGHTITSTYPALCPLICEGNPFKEFAGVRAKCCICACELKESGEVQFTDYGLSGIPIFQISHRVVNELKKGKKVKVTIDLIPDMTRDELASYLKELSENNPRENIFNLLCGLINKKLVNHILKISGIEPGSKKDKLSLNSFENISSTLKNLSFTVIDHKPMKDAQVCQGGIPLKEINVNTMESSLCKGLFFAGEILDVDGKCGGYNLTWAFSTGHIAGDNA